MEGNNTFAYNRRDIPTVALGWTWGGHSPTLVDYKHFELP
jgi:hypothetical protein